MRGSTLSLLIGFALLSAALGHAADQKEFAARASQSHLRSMEVWRQNPASVTAAVAVAHASFDHAEYVTDDKLRASVAQQGIQAGREAVRLDPNSGAAHYWLGMNLGQLARTKSLGAIPLIREIASEFFKARDLDEKLDFSGPDRSLGVLFRDAPGWPTSIGDNKRARQYLQRAVETSPEFPENHLCLLETYEKWGERSNFEQQFKTTERVLKEGRSVFSGQAWEPSWSDWEQRFEKMKARSGRVGRAGEHRGGR